MRRSRISPAEALGVAVLLAWAGLFWYLLATGKWALFLAPRVSWLVPVAAVAFSAGAIGRALTGSGGEGLPSRAQAWTAGAALAPVLLVLVVPLGTLGSYAAQRRTSFAAARFEAGNKIEAGKPLTFQQLVGAAASDEGKAALRRRRGEQVTVVGLAMAPGHGGFKVTRFVVSCCVVDATVAELQVKTTGSAPRDAWVSVRGRLDVAPDGKALIVDAAIAPTTAPDPPYLHP